MRGSVRLAALMKLPVTYVWTHDSIGLGEDGPTHQPIEHLAALRAIPGLDIVRPGDANETAVAWRTILEHTDRPAGLCLSPAEPADVRPGGARPARRARRGARTSSRRRRTAVPQVIIIGTGSEVQIAVTARGAPRGVRHPDPGRLHALQGVVPGAGRGVPADRAAPSGQGAGQRSRRESPWAGAEYVGDDGEIVSIEHYGASAAASVLFEQFGFTADHVVAAAHASLDRVGAIRGETTGN